MRTADCYPACRTLKPDGSTRAAQPTGLPPADVTTMSATIMSAAGTALLPARVPEPFRSDPQFHRSLRAGGVALVAVLVAAAAGVTLALAVGVLLAIVPALVVLPLVVRAGLLGAASSRASRARYPGGPEGRTQWRDAEREAVARGLIAALLRGRRSAGP